LPLVTAENNIIKFVQSEEEQWKKDFRRVLINGGPHKGKTTSMLTFPAPRDIIIVPGELGHSSIVEDGDTSKYWWEINTQITRDKAKHLISQLKSTILEILKKPDIENGTIGLDGIHVLVQLIYKSYGFPDDEAMFGKESYGKGHGYVRNDFMDIIRSVSLSKVGHFVASSYDGNEAISPDGKKTAIFPDLPGQLAKGVMGLFPAVFHAETEGEGQDKRYYWRLQALGEIQGAGIHLPKSVRDAFPQRCKADWKEIEGFMDKAAVASQKRLTVAQPSV
jgi:hypothetical protein